jgi:hypothetical protein
LRLVPGLNGPQVDNPQAGNISPEGPSHWTGRVVGADWASGPSRTGPDHPNQHRGQWTVRWPTSDTAGQRAGSEYGINAAAVAAYRASLDNGKPLSERKLAAMFGKTSRRWARHRMAEAAASVMSAMAASRGSG